MQAQDPKLLAAQLRKPEGDFGSKLAAQLNDSNKYLTRFTYDNLPLKTADKVLETGFGNGKLMFELLNRNATITITGIDFSQDMVNEALAINKKFVNNGTMTLQNATISKIPYSDNYFNHSCTINTLYFWNDPLADAKETLRVLKPGGTFCIGIRPKESVKDMPFVQYGFKLYSKEEACELLKSAGFVNVKYMIKKDPEFEFQGKKIQIDSLVIIGYK